MGRKIQIPAQNTSDASDARYNDAQAAKRQRVFNCPSDDV